MNRHLEPELLDELAADDPRAIRSRRDLRHVNTLMRNVRVIENSMRQTFGARPPRRIADLGAGDGTLMLRVARRLQPAWRNVEVSLVDRRAIVSAETRREFDRLSWDAKTRVDDVFNWLADADGGRVDLMTANLFLHHFDQSALARLMQLAADRTNCFIACEPRRSAAALRASRWLWALGCNEVTQHDAVSSVQAGFTGNELSSLWPANDEWHVHETQAGLFSHCFVARRVIPFKIPGGAQAHEMSVRGVPTHPALSPGRGNSRQCSRAIPPGCPADSIFRGWVAGAPQN